MKIPYGMSSFALIREGGFFYADKTPFVPQLESGEIGLSNLVFLRPRRMGKSLLVSMLEHYYDLAWGDRFDQLFGGLWVHEHPTPERGRYLALVLDFSPVSTDGGHEGLRKSFVRTLANNLRPFVMRYESRFPRLGALYDELDTIDDAAALIGAVIGIAGGLGHKLYVLIDEYDTFANALLSSGNEDVYSAITDSTGFLRTFYRTIKDGTRRGAVGRLFVTGVSPLLLDDLMSGFNIVNHISQNPQFNTMVGFTRADVERAVDQLMRDRPDLAALPGIGDRDALLATMERYYNGYRFSPGADDRVFNSDMVLYFLRELVSWKAYPRKMLDMNVRTDYGQLQRLWSVAGPSGIERRELLQEILDKGFIESPLVEQFGVKSLSLRSQLASLLYYQGMLTLSAEQPAAGNYRLEIPNRVIHELQWEHLAHQLKEYENIHIDTAILTTALLVMARKGDVQPLVDLFKKRVIEAMGLKDFRQFDEKTLKLMLLAFVSISLVFYPLSEKEFAQGHCDLFLGPSGQVPDAKYAWLLELKYLPATAKPRAIEEAFTKANAQLDRYCSDPRLVPMVTRGLALRAGTLVFVSGKDVLFREWAPAGASGRRSPGAVAPGRSAGAALAIAKTKKDTAKRGTAKRAAKKSAPARKKRA